MDSSLPPITACDDRLPWGSPRLGDWTCVLRFFAATSLLGASSPALQTTELASVDSTGVQGNAASYEPALSSDGRYVAFTSAATNLVPGFLDYGNVYVHDRQTGTTELVSVDSNGIPQNGECAGCKISWDGRYVAFFTNGDNLVPGDTNGQNDVFVRDRQAGVTECASVDSSGNLGNGHSYVPALSADDRYVGFHSASTNLVAGDTNGVDDVFVHDRQTGITQRVSIDSSGNQANDWSQFPALSGDGRYVAFASNASNLVPGDTNGAPDVFVRDRQTGMTERASVDSSGSQGNGSSQLLANNSSISGDGRYVVFDSSANNLVAGDTNGQTDVFVRDRQSGITQRVSIGTSGNQADGFSAFSSISWDGRYAEYVSAATNLVSGDTNGFLDVFVRERSCSDQFANYCTAGTSASGCIVRMRSTGMASASAASGFVVIASFAEGQKDGLFFYGQNGQQANPWGNGTSFQCVAPPVKRGGLQPGNGTVGVCDSVVSQDLNALWCAGCPKPAHVPIAGKKLQIQFWYRDPLNTSNQSTSLSDAIEVGVCP